MVMLDKPWRSGHCIPGGKPLAPTRTSTLAKMQGTLSIGNLKLRSLIRPWNASVWIRQVKSRNVRFMTEELPVVPFTHSRILNNAWVTVFELFPWVKPHYQNMHQFISFLCSEAVGIFAAGALTCLVLTNNNPYLCGRHWINCVIIGR
jgi:hypothetical protein